MQCLRHRWLCSFILVIALLPLWSMLMAVLGRSASAVLCPQPALAVQMMALGATWTAMLVWTLRVTMARLTVRERLWA